LHVLNICIYTSNFFKVSSLHTLIKVEINIHTEVINRVLRAGYHIEVVTCNPHNLESLQRVIQYIEYLFAGSAIADGHVQDSGLWGCWKMASRLNVTFTVITFICHDGKRTSFAALDNWLFSLGGEITIYDQRCLRTFALEWFGNIAVWKHFPSPRLCSVTNCAMGTSAFVTAKDDCDFTAKKDVVGVFVFALVSFILCSGWPGAYSYHRRHAAIFTSRAHTIQWAYMVTASLHCNECSFELANPLLLKLTLHFGFRFLSLCRWSQCWLYRLWFSVLTSI